MDLTDPDRYADLTRVHFWWAVPVRVARLGPRRSRRRWHPKILAVHRQTGIRVLPHRTIG